MNIVKEQEKRRDFCLILFDLAKSQTLLKDGSERSSIYKRLEQVYNPEQGEKPFKHFYSDIFSVLSSIQKDDDLGNIDILAQNLSEIRKGYQPKNFDVDGNHIDVSDSIRKLYDHVSLDVARMRYSDAGDWSISQTQAISEVQTKVVKVKADVDLAKKELSEEVVMVREEVQNVQKEYITILGIFAAVVLAFTGGIAFTTSIFENLHIASVYRVLLVALVIGFVLSNVLYGLFYYIDCLVYKKDKYKIKPLTITNAILLTLMLITCIAWYYGFIEKRNERINNSDLHSVSIGTSLHEIDTRS